MPPRLRASLRLLGHLCRLGLATLFLSAGLLKGLDPEGFAREVAQYGILSGSVARVFAYLLIPVEVIVGAALLVNFRTILNLAAATGLMLMFIGAVSYAIATDQPLTECGCFGRSAPRTPHQTLVEDAIFLAAGLVGLIALRGAAGATGGGSRRTTWKGPAIAATALASSAFVVASPHLPIDDLATALRPGVRWEELQLALAEVDLREGRHLVAIMGMRDPATVEALEGLNRLAASGRFSVVGLYADDDEAYTEFFWTRGPSFPLYHAAPAELRRLHRRLPRFFAVKDGVIAATWERTPTEDQLAGALE